MKFHFFNTLYYIRRAITYSFTIAHLDYFMAGNFRLKSVQSVLFVKNLNSINSLRANTLKGKFPLRKKS